MKECVELLLFFLSEGLHLYESMTWFSYKEWLSEGKISADFCWKIFNEKLLLESYMQQCIVFVKM